MSRAREVDPVRVNWTYRSFCCCSLQVLAELQNWRYWFAGRLGMAAELLGAWTGETEVSPAASRVAAASPVKRRRVRMWGRPFRRDGRGDPKSAPGSHAQRNI